jgi:prolipoprotein diacylglyceryltransferase
MTPNRPLYAFFMVLALAVFLLARRLLPAPAGWRALSARRRLALALSAFLGGVLGGKLPFALASGGDWLAGDAWFQDGKTLTTALAGGYLAVELAKLALGVRTGTGDAFALPLALALAVGRWGCFCNGCCYGVATGWPWGVDFGDGVRRHPTQAYESLFHLGMAGVLAWLVAREALPARRLKFYLIAYAAYRFATEYIRPEPVGVGGLTFYQWVSLALIAGLSAQWLVGRRAAVPAVARR